MVFEREARLYVYALLPSHPLIVVAHCSTGCFLLPCNVSAAISPVGPRLVAWHPNGDDQLRFFSSRFRDRTVTDLFVSPPLAAGWLHLDSIFPFLSLPPFCSSPVSRSLFPITLSLNYPTFRADGDGMTDRHARADLLACRLVSICISTPGRLPPLAYSWAV